MLLFITGLILFFAVHSISIVNVGWRDAMAERLGTGTWKILYSLASLAGLVLLIQGYGLARGDPVILYAPARLVALRQLSVDAVRVSAVHGRLFTGADKDRGKAPGSRFRQDLGFCPFADQRRPCRRVAVRLFPGLGGGWAYLHETSQESPRARFSGKLRERSPRRGGRPVAVPAVHHGPARLADWC